MIYKIRIDGLKVYGYHGVMQHEKDFGQEFVIDCHLDVEAAGEDSIESTVSYALVAQEIERITKQKRFELIETLASTLLAATLDLDPRVIRATITVHKPSAPLNQEFRDVSVSVSGARRED
ncbi:MAG: dihydroneopterin aldolase [Aquiluna sp.]